MNRSEFRPISTMQQIDPNEDIASQVRKLNEAYRNLFDRVEKVEALVNRIADSLDM